MNTELDKKQILSKFIKLSSLICAIMVIGVHAYNTLDLDLWSVPSRITGSLSHGVFTSAVPIFFVLSGYLFFVTAKSLRSVFVKQRKRLLTLLVPFLSVSTMYCILHIAVLYVTKSDAIAAISPLSVILDIVFYRQVGTLWFLFQLILYVVLCPILYYVLKNKVVSTCFLAATAVLGLLAVKLAVPVDGAGQTLFSFNGYFYFVLGAWIASLFDLSDIIIRLSRINVFVSIAGIALAGFGEGLLLDLYGVRYLVPVVSFFVAALLANLTFRVPDNKVTHALFGIPTLVVYGFHPAFARIFLNITEAFIPWPLASYFIVIILTAVFTCALAVLIKKIRITNILFNGNR